MRSIRMLALITWLFVASLAVAGFATFSPPGSSTADLTAAVPVESQPLVAAVPSSGGQAVGRVAALALTNGLTEAPEGLETDEDERPRYAPFYETLGPDGSTTTTLAPPPPPRPAQTAVPTGPSSAPLSGSEQPGPIPPTAGTAANSIGPCSASWYGEYFRGRSTASGEPYNPDDFTAAHKTLPLGSIVTVTRVDTGASVSVRINDRGPYVGSRCVDLSRAAMSALDGISAGVITVVLNH